MQKTRETKQRKSGGLRRPRRHTSIWVHTSRTGLRGNFFQGGQISLPILIIFFLYPTLIIACFRIFSNHSSVNWFERQLVFNLPYSTDITLGRRGTRRKKKCRTKRDGIYIKKIQKVERRKVTFRVILIPAVISVDYRIFLPLPPTPPTTVSRVLSNELMCCRGEA